MGYRMSRLPKGIRRSSSWPYTEMPERKTPGRRSGGWVMAISIDPELNGLVTYYPAGSVYRQTLHVDDGSLWGKKITTWPFYRVQSKGEAERFCGTFCTMGYGRSESLLPHQDGIFWGFNWSSLTRATVHIASQVADHFFNGHYDRAWTVGHAFEDQIRAAEKAAHEAAWGEG